jgi:biopolymer transport protein ExbD
MRGKLKDRRRSVSSSSLGWLRAVSKAAPWLAVIVATLMMYMLSGTFTIKKGTIFDLPDNGNGESLQTELVAFVMRSEGDTLIFFDDSRYILGDEASLSSFSTHLAGRVKRNVQGKGHLLVLADKNITTGELMKLADITKSAGVKKTLFAERGVAVNQKKEID